MTAPTTARVPYAYITIDGSGAVTGPGVLKYKILAVGNKLSTGSASALELKRITNISQAKDFFGEGSCLERMIAGYLENNSVTELQAIALDDAVAGVASTGKFGISGTATESGVLYLYIGGEQTQVPVTSGDTAAEIVTTATALLNANKILSVSAVANAGDLELTAKNKGEQGDEISLDTSFNGEEIPSGIIITETAMDSGAGNPVLSSILPIIGDEQYHLMLHHYHDATNLSAMDSEFENRFDSVNQNEGIQLTVSSKSYSDLIIFGESRNSRFLCIAGYKGPSLPWLVSGALTGQVAKSAEQDSAVPFQNVGLLGVLAPQIKDEFIWSERNNLLFSGISTLKSQSGKVYIERMITTYRTNAAGATDVAFLNLNTMTINIYLRWDLRNTMLRKYARHKLADDGQKFRRGQKVMTPSLGKSEMVSIYKGWIGLGLVENLDAFKEALVVERSDQDRDRLEFTLRPDLMNQLRIISMTLGFKL
jgi:phage tail sheath gpL-like